MTATGGSNLRPDIDLAVRLFEELREKTFDGVGITREAYGRGEQIAHAAVAEAGRALGLEIENDFAGNLYLTLPGQDRAAKRTILGSHLDSVTQGGNYDGAAGVLAGLAVVAGLKQAGFRPARDVTVMAIRAEEAGSWFPFSYPGSHMALGQFPPDLVDKLKRKDTGRSLADHMAECGFDPAAVRQGRKHLSPDSVAQYVELHIEQGPVLEAERIPVGIVTGIPGSLRYREARVLGAYSHSGAVPRRYRQDAAMAFAAFAHRLDRTWERLLEGGEELVVTFCTVSTDPKRAGFTKIPGEVEFSLDIRSVAEATLAKMAATIAEAVAAVEASHHVRFALGEKTGSTPGLMDPGLRAALRRAGEAAGVRYKEMPSGAGHDAAAFAAAGIPSAMLFVRNQNGSHNPHEAMEIADFAEACKLLTAFVAAA